MPVLSWAGDDVITIECRCAHFRHRSYLEKIMAHVIAGLLEPRTWVPCTECANVAFWIDEHGARGDSQLRMIEGGG